jgi:hypothetical protein
LKGTTISIYIDKPKNNSMNISTCSQWRIMLIVHFNFEFKCTSQGFQGWNPKYRSSNIKETYGLVKVTYELVKCNVCS